MGRSKSKSKRIKKPKTTKRTLHYFWRALMQAKFRTLIVLLATPLYIFIGSIVIPKCTSQVVDLLSGESVSIDPFTTILTVYVIAEIVRMILIRIIDWTDWRLDAVGGQYLSKLSFDAIINQSMDFHSNRFSGSLTSQASKLSGAYINFKSTIIWNGAPLILAVVYSLVAAFFISPFYAIILSAFLAVYTILSVILYSKTREADEKLPTAENKLVGRLSDAITNIANIKSYAREDFERRRYAHFTQEVFDATMHNAKVNVVRYGTLNFISTALEVASIFSLIYIRMNMGISIGDIVLLYSLTANSLHNIWGIGPLLRSFNRAFGDAKEMVEILDTPVNITDRSTDILKVKNAEIDFHNISFRHADQKENLFENFSLKISPGERIGLVGISGSGKTTLTKLLLRFSDVSEGEILIDGQNIAHVTQQSLRQNIAYVPQETLLFHRTIAENISYGKLNATKAEIERVAHLSSADAFINKLPEKYKTLAGERGNKLSGGQRQRIAIARAFLKDAPILILDEATSALDSESEAIIQEASERLMKGRTSIVIAHRLSTIASLDRIIVLKDGKIIEQGSHRQLLLRDGPYKKLWSRQSGAFLESKDEETPALEEAE